MATLPSSQAQADQRLNMVNGQLRTSDIHDSEVLSAFLNVPRESFVSPALSRLAYVDQDQPASGPSGRKLLAPRTLALLLQAAVIQPGERVLDVGGGSGYSAAVLSRLGAVVVMLETDVSAARAALAGVERVEMRQGDLAAGAPDHGPFDVILINGAFEEFPSALLRQLGEHGRLLGVDARSSAIRGTIIEKSAAGFSERPLFDAKADVLDAFRRAPSFAF